MTSFENVVSFSDAFFSDFGDVNQAFYFVADFNDSAEGQEAENFYFNDFANVQFASFNFPRIFLGSFDGQCNAFVFAVDFFDEYFYFVTNLCNFFSFSIAVPGEFGVVNQANEASANFYEQTEFSNFNNFTCNGGAFFNGSVSSFFSSSASFFSSSDASFFSFFPSFSFSFFFSFQQVATRNNDAFLFEVNFDDFSFHFLTNITGEVFYTFQFNVGSRHEAFYAFNSNCQANDVFSFIFDDADNFNGSSAFFAFCQFCNVFPSCVAFSFNFGHTNKVVFRSTGDNFNFYFVANFDGSHQFFSGFSQRPFRIGYNAFAHIAKIYIYAIFIQLNNGSFHDFTGIYVYLLTLCQQTFKIHVFHCYNSLLN